MTEDEKMALAAKMPENVRDTFLTVARMLDRRKRIAGLVDERIAAPVIAFVETIEDVERYARFEGAAVLGGLIGMGLAIAHRECPPHGCMHWIACWTKTIGE